MGGGALRERGRPARMHCHSVPLGFPAIWHSATLPAGTAWARPKQNPGAAAGRAGWRRWVRLCQCCAGETPALPGGASSNDGVAAKQVPTSICNEGNDMAAETYSYQPDYAVPPG